jgi:hypothetical protein
MFSKDLVKRSKKNYEHLKLFTCIRYKMILVLKNR